METICRARKAALALTDLSIYIYILYLSLLEKKISTSKYNREETLPRCSVQDTLHLLEAGIGLYLLKGRIGSAWFSIIQYHVHKRL